MRKKIVIGCILVLSLLLLMPSIPAIQQRTIEDNVKEYKEHLEKNKWEPDLYWITLFILARVIRGIDLISKGSNYWLVYRDKLEINNPIKFIRGFWLLGTTIILVFILDIIVKIMGWEYYEFWLP